LQVACELWNGPSSGKEKFSPLSPLFFRLLPELELLPGLQRSFPFSPGLPRASGVGPAGAGSQGSLGSLVALGQLGHGAGHTPEMVFTLFQEFMEDLGRRAYGHPIGMGDEEDVGIRPALAQIPRHLST